MEQIDTTNINTENDENVYLTDSEDKYLLDKNENYLTTNDKKENNDMANTKKYVSLDKLGLYDEKIKAKIATDDAATLKSAKDYADSLASNYDAAGLAATAEANAKAYADGKDAAIAEAKKQKSLEDNKAKAAEVDKTKAVDKIEEPEAQETEAVEAEEAVVEIEDGSDNNDTPSGEEQ